VVITYCTGFCFESAAVVANNSYVDITFTAGTYNTNGGSGALEASDFSVTFSQNGGSATAASISSIKKNDNAAEISASALSGGETVVRMFLNITGSPAGVEIIAISPASGSSIYDSDGTAMNAASTILATLNDVNGPYITGATIPSTNATVAVTFSEAAYNTNGGSGALETSDFSLSISGGAATLSSATPTSISISSNTYTLGFGLSGTPNGSETLTVSPVANSIYDAGGTAATTSQSNNTAELYDTRLSTAQTLIHETGGGMYNSFVRMDHDTYLLQYSGYSTDGYLATFTIDADGDPITEVIQTEWNAWDVHWPSLVQINENTYIMAYQGVGTGSDYNGNAISNQWGQWIGTFKVKADGSSITKLGFFRHDTYTDSNPYNSLVKVDDDTYVLAYRGHNQGTAGGTNWGGWIKTFTVNEGTITQTAQLRHYDNQSYWHSLVQVDANTYLLAYGDYYNDGWLKTFTIPTDGSSITAVASLEIDDVNHMNSLVQLDADTYVNAWLSTTNN